MRASRTYGWWVVAAVAIAGVRCPAQQMLGERLPQPRWAKWLQGEAVAVRGEQAPRCTMYAFYNGSLHAPAFAGDGDYLADLQRRFADQGLVVVAVVADAEATPPLASWPGCRVVADDDGATATEWLGDASAPWHVLLVDKNGVAVFAGHPAAGLVDALDATLAGRVDVDRERNALTARHSLIASFDDYAAADAAQGLGQVLALSPRDGVSLGLAYLVEANKRSDVAAAAKVLQRACTSLAAESRPLAAFADLALRGDPRRPGLAAALTTPLKAAAAASPHDVVVQFAYLRALVLAGDSREVGKRAMKLRKLATTADTCLDFATILTADPVAAPHRDLATIVLDEAERLGADARLLTAARFGVAMRCADDAAEQKRLLDAYFAAGDRDVTDLTLINNDCWYLMTELPTMGRYDAFAAGLAGRMLERREQMDYFQFDTAALAMFLAGRVADAISLQETAIEQGGKGDADYEARLLRYKAAQTPAPR